jgi:hypothetical protein
MAFFRFFELTLETGSGTHFCPGSDLISSRRRRDGLVTR